jgi:hypothetical protein
MYGNTYDRQLKKLISSVKLYLDLIGDPFYNYRATRVRLDIACLILKSEEFTDMTITDKTACLIAVWGGSIGQLYSKVGYIRLSESIMRRLMEEVGLPSIMRNKVCSILTKACAIDPKRVYLDSLELSMLCPDLWEERIRWASRFNSGHDHFRDIQDEFYSWYSNCLLLREDGMRTREGREFYKDAHPVFLDYIKYSSMAFDFSLDEKLVFN